MHDNQRYVKSTDENLCFSPLLRRAKVDDKARLPEGVTAMLAMSVRMFLIAIVVLGIATVAFLIATA